MFKKIKERGVHLIILAFATGTFLGMNISLTASVDEPAHRYLDYFHKVYQIIKSEAVDLPSNKELFYGAIKGMIGALDDPFSRFLDEKAAEDLNEMTTGKFVGVGIEITMRDEEVVVITPMDDSPAMSAGIMSGDVIVKVNDIAIRGKKLTEIIKLIKGLPDTEVKLSVRREGYDELLDLNVKRAPIKIDSVEHTIVADKKIGYVKIKNFGNDTAKDVRAALEDFNSKKIEKVVVDLRYNPGGLLGSAIEICDLFLEKGQTIVSTRGRKGSRTEKIFKSLNDPICKAELIVLVNKGSASASEIFSGAIRDNKRGRLLGEKTFGKGSVQKTFSLDRKIGVAVTIAKYYTPSGELIHKKGIKPDYKVEIEKVPEKDRSELKKMYSGKILEGFVKKGMKYDEDTVKQFGEHLKKNSITLTDHTSRFFLKRRLARFKKRELIDLEFDNQLSAALGKFK